jgi:hypothetical protein
MSVLPVSEIVLLVDAAADVEDPGDVEPELPQAASSASGARAAAAHTVRNRMDTREYSFISRTLTRALVRHARSCVRL